MDYNELLYAAEVRKIAEKWMRSKADPTEDGYEDRLASMSLNTFIVDADRELQNVAKLIASTRNQQAK